MIRGRYIGHEGVPSIVCIHCEEDGTLLRGTRDGEDLRLIYCGGARFLAVKPDDPNGFLREINGSFIQLR